MNILHIIYQFITCQTSNEARIKKKMHLKKKKWKGQSRMLSYLNDDQTSSFFDPRNICRHFRMGMFERSQLMVLLFHNLWFKIFRYKCLTNSIILMIFIILQYFLDFSNEFHFIYVVHLRDQTRSWSISWMVRLKNDTITIFPCGFLSLILTCYYWTNHLSLIIFRHRIKKILTYILDS